MPKPAGGHCSRRDHETLGSLINANFDLRAKVYRISAGNLEMIETARGVGATSQFAGSGGAIVGTYRDEQMFGDLVAAMRRIGVEVLKPQVLPPAKSRHILEP